MAMLPKAEKEKGRQKEIPFCQPSLPTEIRQARQSAHTILFVTS
jgi:hypothetical protein